MKRTQLVLTLSIALLGSFGLQSAQARSLSHDVAQTQAPAAAVAQEGSDRSLNSVAQDGSDRSINRMV
jgi:hypothetical protein